MVDRNEFYSADLLVAPTQNLMKKNGSSSEDMSKTEKEDVNMKEGDEEEEDESRQPERKTPRRAAAK